MTTWRDEKGFTLLEVLVALALLGLVLAAVVTIQQSVTQAFMTSANKTNAQQNARIAVDMMAREIRESTVAITTATANSITFTSPTAGVVTYTVDAANNLTRNGAALIGGVQSVNFSYRDNADAVLAAPVGAPSSIRRIDITIRTRTEDPTVVGGSPVDAWAEVTTSVRLRNLS